MLSHGRSVIPNLLPIYSSHDKKNWKFYLRSGIELDKIDKRKIDRNKEIDEKKDSRTDRRNDKIIFRVDMHYGSK